LRSIGEMIDGGTATKTSIPSPTPVAARILAGMVPYVAPDDVEPLVDFLRICRIFQLWTSEISL
jgi:hypothetical protein